MAKKRVVTKKKYWYYFTVYYCPFCSKTTTYKEREYSRRPKRYDKRHEFIESCDNCELL